MPTAKTLDEFIEKVVYRPDGSYELKTTHHFI